MKIRMMALAGVALLALAAPAAASDATGWYGDITGGWDHLGNLTIAGSKVATQDSALVTGAIGYRFADRIRFEGEFGWDQHDAQTSSNGHLRLLTGMLNAAYDWQLAPKWDFTLGAGAGFGSGEIQTSV